MPQLLVPPSQVEARRSPLLVLARPPLDLMRSTLAVVQPDTVIRWHRTAWRRYRAWKSRRGPGYART